MSVLDLFKSSDKVIEKTTDGIYNGIDKMAFTDEEKSDAKQKWLESTIDFQKSLMQEGLPSSVSRRILAWMIAGVFLFLTIAGVVIWKWDQAWSKFIFEEGVARLEFGFGAVITTYFVYHGVAKWVKGKKE